ncbi:AEC family transporter [Adlercreutzia sp. ZJ141]|uniref:AEC family transporter n=1 Tax=Adlercreutzia sp. ZJ141 TaxID=2709406 RepID=UPI001F156917|nr:AEC family transporter [Adlercreutzia sp. ZJ141]
MGKDRWQLMPEGFASIIQQMAVLFSIIAVGYIANKTGLMGREFDKHISKLVLNVSLPAMILASVLDVSEIPSRSDILTTVVLAFFAYLVLIAIAFIFCFVARCRKGMRGVYRFMLVFGNTGFLGFPVVAAIFGNEAIIYASICNLPFNLLVFTIGAWFISSDSEEATPVRVSVRTFATPALIACLATIAFALAGVCAVPFAGPALSTLGSFTTPAAMLIVGSAMANMPVRDLLGNPRLFAMAVVRLLVTPAIIYLTLHAFVSNAVLLGVLVVTCGMPVATNGTMLCYEYGGNSKVMAQGTFITTVASLVSVPLLVLLLG